MICISMILSVFEFAQLTPAVKLVVLQPFGRKFFLVKPANAPIFSPVDRK